MRAEVKERWLEALRGGKYDQCSGMLKRSDNRYCCLGVLCDISGVGYWKTFENSVIGGTSHCYVVDSSNIISMIEDRVSDWAELDIGTARALAEMNDGGMSFQQIANYIEKNL